jgi:nitrate reductase gamma subunit
VILHVALPYAAIVLFLAGLVWRYRSRSTISSLSSQMLESRWLVWGAVPFHLGIALILLGHLAPLLFPSQWQSLVSNRNALLTVETIGAGAAILCLVGLVVLFVRRISSAYVRSASTIPDLIVLAVLIAQVALGLGVAMMHRWGAVWSVRTTTPYLWSLLTLQPDPALVAGVPLLVTLHLTGAWLVLALIPFTRLVHMFTWPLRYLGSRPQKVIWQSAR